MLRSLNDTHLGGIAPLLIPQQGSLDQVSVRQGYTETKCVCVCVFSAPVSTEHSQNFQVEHLLDIYLEPK